MEPGGWQWTVGPRTLARVARRHAGACGAAVVCCDLVALPVRPVCGEILCTLRWRGRHQAHIAAFFTQSESSSRCAILFCSHQPGSGSAHAGPTPHSCRVILGHSSSQRLGLPSPSMSGLDDSGSGVVSGSAGGAGDDPSRHDLAAPFFRMRFGRDLRLAEVRTSPHRSSRHRSPACALATACASLRCARAAKHVACQRARPAGACVLLFSCSNDHYPSRPSYSPLVISACSSPTCFPVAVLGCCTTRARGRWVASCAGAARAVLLAPRSAAQHR